MPAPSIIHAGDLVTWTDTRAPAAATGVTAHLRTNQAGQGVSVAGTYEPTGGWTFSLGPQVTADMAVGLWAVQLVATLPDGPFTYAPLERVEVRPSLAFGEGGPAAFDPRSQTELELVDVRNAIQAVYRSLEYRIGTADGGRMVKRADLPWLVARERQLLQRLAAERQGGRSRRLLTYFPGD